MVAVIANRQTVSMINLRTGKSHHHFSMNAIRIDSVLDKTYNQFYTGKRIYFFDSTNTEVNTFQLTDMCFDDGHFYIYLNCEVEVKYINDSTALNSNLSAPQTKEALERYSISDLHFMEYVQFLAELDTELKLIRIVPLYQPASLENKYSPSFQLGFGLKKGSIFVPLLPANWGVNYRTKVNANGIFYSMAKLELDDTTVHLICSNQEADYSNFTLVNYLGSKRLFHSVGNNLLFCNGKEIRSLDDNKVAFKADAVKSNEWIDDFFMDDEFIILKTSRIIPKKHPTKMDVAYAIDSIGEQNIIVYDREFRTKQYLPLNLNDAGSFAITKHQLFYIKRDKEHYYVCSIPFEKN